MKFHFVIYSLNEQKTDISTERKKINNDLTFCSIFFVTNFCYCFCSYDILTG